MKTLSQYRKKINRIYQNPGSTEHKLYSSKFNDDGILELIECGSEHIPSMIQSHAESVDINVILQRYAEGDEAALRRRQMLFGDFTLVPKTYADVLNLAIRGEEYFLSLPLDIREKYDHDFGKYLAEMSKLQDVPADGVKGSSQPFTEEADNKRERVSEKGADEV